MLKCKYYNRRQFKLVSPSKGVSGEMYKALQAPMPLQLWSVQGLCTDMAMMLHRANPSVVPGRTIVSGTEQGLFARAQPRGDLVLVVQATTDAGVVMGPHVLDLTDPSALLRCATPDSFPE